MRTVNAGLERVAAWSRSPARAAHVYVVAAAIGLAAFVIVYGANQVVGTNAYWQMPQQDERQALMGYRYFLHDSWHWPVFLNHAINVPYPKSIAFLDCIPLWALVNKAIATIIPPWESFSAHAYVGLWHGLVYILQACLGVANLRALGHRSWRTGIATAVFFVAIPTWIFRYAHPALSAHWIELWGLYLYLRTPVRASSPRALGLARLCQLAVAALTNPYHAVMSLGLFIAALLRSRDWRTVALWLPLGFVWVGVANWFLGYFTRESAIRQWGFRFESTNLLSWLVPQRSAVLGKADWIANVNGTPWQYEGYAYLGLGYLALLALFIPHVKIFKDVTRRHAVLFILVLGSCLFALSNHVYFGSHEIFNYPIPKLLRWIPDQFRSPGRFVWVPTYVLVVFLLHWAFRHFASGRRFVVVVLAMVLQVVDATGEWAWQRTVTTGPVWAMLDLPRWRPLVHAHREVFIVPPYGCVFDDRAPRLDFASMEIQMLASERALPINGTYAAREMRRCASEEAEWPTLELRPGALYILLPQAEAIAERFAAHGAHCGTFDFGRACSANAAAIGAALHAGALRPPPAAIALGYGDKLELASASTLAASWTAAEAGGRWTDTSIAAVVVRLDGEPPPGVSLKLQARARLCGARQVQDVDVLLDETLLTTLHFDAASNDATRVRTVAIPDRERLRDRAVAIQLRPHDIRTPEKLRCDGDARRLGVWVSSLWFE